MKTKRSLPITIISVLLAVGITQLSAQSSLWLSSINYESPSLVAPIAVLVVPSESRGKLTFGILGWTLASEWTKALDTVNTTVISAEITPLHSHSSNYVYRNGNRDVNLQYSNLTLQMKTGLRVAHTARWHSEFNLVGLYESVSGLSDKEDRDYWKRPFVGIEITQSYSNKISDDIFQSRWDGIKLSNRFQIFTGHTTWWRDDLTLGCGKKLGWAFLRGGASFLLGNSLNRVNQFLVGGSWDLLGTNALYGYHYAEFRLNRGFLLDAGLDIRLIGNWELGVRGSYLNSPSKTSYGEAIKLMTVWNGIAFNAGVAFPEDSMIHNDFSRMIIIAGLTAAIFDR